MDRPTPQPRTPPARSAPAAPAPARPGRRAPGLLPAGAIALAALLAYLPALGGAFVFDDVTLVAQSDLLRGPLGRIWFSTEPLDYWPLAYTSFWLEWRLWGAAPLPYHLLNVALHAAGAVLLWRVLRRLAVPGAWLAGLLFAVHPVAVESVAWISERKNVLSGALLLGAVLAWLGPAGAGGGARGTGRGQGGSARAATGGGADAAAVAGGAAGGRPWLALALYLLALLAKTSTVMLPPALLLLAWWRAGRVGRRDLAATAPFFALAGCFGAVTVWFQQERAMSGGWSSAGWAERAGRSAWALVTYLRQAFLPVDLAFLYPPWPPATEPIFWLPLGLVAAGAPALWCWGRRGPLRPVLAAVACHALMVLPVLGLVEIAYFAWSPMSNHLQYLALPGPVALVAAGLDWLRRRWPWPGAAAAGLVACALALSTASRASAFRDELSLWSAAARDAPQSFNAAWTLALRLGDAGRPREARQALEQARDRLRDPASRLRATALLHLVDGRPGEAVAEAARAQALREDPVFQLELGTLLTGQDQPGWAAEVLRAELARQPANGQVRYRLGSALARAGRLEEAIEVTREACRLSPRRGGSCPALVVLLARAGRPEEIRGAVAAALGTGPADGRVDEIIARSGVREPR